MSFRAFTALALEFVVFTSFLSCGNDSATGGASIDTGTQDFGAGEPETGGAPDDTGAPYDSGDDAGAPADGGEDAATDTGSDTGPDAGSDAGTPHDAGGDAGTQHDGGDGGGGDAGKAIWTPPPGTTWQIQFSGTLDTAVDVEVYDIDLFDTAQAHIDALKTAGRKVICYFSAGSYEDWRPDKGSFKKADYGKALDNWPGEWWLDVRSQNVKDIMAARMDLAVQKRCDGVDPDNVDGYQNDTGFPLTDADQEDYLVSLSAAAHDRGLSIGLKNCLGLVDKVVKRFEWQINEECMSYSECDMLRPFIDNGRAVFHIEYVNQASEGPAKKSEVCGKSEIAGFSTLIKTWDLSAWRLACP
jgi:endo-alpha-1,4-polygalactosaminidase (GH114 family)